MYTLFVILAVITAVLLAIVVLIQESKGGGLASNVSSANSVLVYARLPTLWRKQLGRSPLSSWCSVLLLASSYTKTRIVLSM